MKYQKSAIQPIEFIVHCPDCEDAIELPIPHEEGDGSLTMWPEDKFHKCSGCGCHIEAVGIRIYPLEKIP